MFSRGDEPELGHELRDGVVPHPCFDNAVADTTFSTVKVEYIHRRQLSVPVRLPRPGINRVSWGRAAAPAAS